MDNGLYKDMSNEDYHSCEALSTSQIKNMTVPAKAKYRMEHKFQSSAAMDLGTLVHTLVLEPSKFDSEYAVSPKFDGRTKQGKADKAAFEEENKGKTIVDQPTLDKAVKMAESVFNHPEAKHLVDGLIPEQSIFWEHEGQQLRCRPDGVNGSVVIDLKTARDASPKGFTKAICDRRYDLQQAIYEDGCNTQFKVTDFVFIVVESEAPYLTAVYRIKKEYIDLARDEYKALLDNWKTAQEFDYYEGYSDSTIELSLPGWFRKV